MKINWFYRKLNKTQQKHHGWLLNFCAIYELEAQNADNARTLGIWFDDELVKFMQQTTSPLSEGDGSLCN